MQISDGIDWNARAFIELKFVFNGNKIGLCPCKLYGTPHFSLQVDTKKRYGRFAYNMGYWIMLFVFVFGIGADRFPLWLQKEIQYIDLRAVYTIWVKQRLQNSLRFHIALPIMEKDTTAKKCVGLGVFWSTNFLTMFN